MFRFLFCCTQVAHVTSSYADPNGCIQLNVHINVLCRSSTHLHRSPTSCCGGPGWRSPLSCLCCHWQPYSSHHLAKRWQCDSKNKLSGMCEQVSIKNVKLTSDRNEFLLTCFEDHTAILMQFVRCEFGTETENRS